uniref:BPTI/Kunitz inhibitor domain-containing protein n=1 Tax=Acrobeloides nanus TaxID=290746 RepID=A0A914EDA4_9BILA
MPSQSFPQPQSIPQITASASFGSYPYMSVSTSGSPCSLPQQIGTGPYRIPRWYFNPARMRCELFYWSGCCGNGNNFPNFQACQQSCEGQHDSSNPLYVVPFALTSEQDGSFQTQIKIVQSSGVSPSQWLLNKNNVGNQRSQMSSDCCGRPFSAGFGDYRIPRWYYEPQSGACLIYHYRGYGGFGNNFRSMSECQEVCAANSNSLPRTSITISASNGGGNPSSSEPLPHFVTTNQNSVFELPTTIPHFLVVNQEATTTAPPQKPIRGHQLIHQVDPCSQDRDQGVGALQLPRYYYNKETKLCEQFIYFGSGGNRNNFMTVEECQNQCPESPNPCAYGTPTTIIQCASGSVMTQTCTGQQFCHVGASPQTTICCNKPTNVDRCQQPLNVGIGNANLQRWYYNPLSQQCQTCVYRGLQGNENNFLSRSDCENSCAVNPCARGVPYKGQGVTVQCSTSNQAVCPAGYYCHFGADMQTTVCCQALVSNPCNDPVSKGEGKASLTRFYYDQDKRQCLPFNYLGTKGNTNNFLSQEACETVCPVWVNPCTKGEPIMGINNRPEQCHHRQPCPTGYYCHIGYDDETTVCCPSQILDPCSAPMNEGVGPHVMTRWYYETQTRKCQQFTYKGLHGNENNFLLRDHCEQACPVWDNACPAGEPILMTNQRPRQCNPQSEESCPVTHWCHHGVEPASTVCCPGRQDPCVLPKVEGEGKFSQLRWYFDLETKTCIQFNFRGMKGNANNFVSQEDCESKCPVFIDPCPTSYTFSGSNNAVNSVYLPCSKETKMCPDTYWCHVGDNAKTTVCCPNAVDPCALVPKISGLGELRLTRWSFDSKTRKCEPFDYYGLKGNQNNFLTRDECESKCPVFENPCRSGEPFMLQGQPQICKRETPCPSSYYCHIGSNDIKYCCPVIGGDPCGQPMDRGRGTSQLPRWYWDQAQQKCLPFTYCGQKGTQNNFLTQQDCERTCFVFVNPCTVNIPLPPETCTPNNQQTCTPGSWCHIGSGPDTTLCCPNAVTNPCLLPMSTGEGNSNLERFYFDQNSKSCKPFTYAGLKGNQNNFLSLRACQLQCQPLDNPCIGQPATTPTGQVLFCSATNRDVCPVNFWCHLGAVPETTVCCPGPTNPCSVPLAPGTGNAGIQRWYYNPDDRECVPFQYNGKRGNQNNFLTQAECARTCPEQLCLLSIDRGACAGRQTRYAFNRQSNQCVPFEYTGCGGNLNNFQTMADCMGTCGNIGFRRR